MEKMLALLLLTFTIGLLVGEELRDFLYGDQISQEELLPDPVRISGRPALKKGKKWKRYSGLFVLIKQKWSISADQRAILSKAALDTFLALVHYPVRIHV